MVEKSVITEQELNDIVYGTVVQLMNEGFFDTLKGGAQGLKQVGQKMMGNMRNGSSQGKSAMDMSLRDVGNGIKNTYNNVKNGMQATGQAMRAGANNANVQKTIQNLLSAIQNFEKQAASMPGINGPQTQNAIAVLKKQLSGASGRGKANVSAFANSAANQFAGR